MTSSPKFTLKLKYRSILPDIEYPAPIFLLLRDEYCDLSEILALAGTCKYLRKLMLDDNKFWFKQYAIWRKPWDLIISANHLGPITMDCIHMEDNPGTHYPWHRIKFRHLPLKCGRYNSLHYDKDKSNMDSPYNRWSWELKRLYQEYCQKKGKEYRPNLEITDKVIDRLQAWAKKECQKPENRAKYSWSQGDYCKLPDFYKSNYRELSVNYNKKQFDLQDYQQNYTKQCHRASTHFEYVFDWSKYDQTLDYYALYINDPITNKFVLQTEYEIKTGTKSAEDRIRKYQSKIDWLQGRIDSLKTNVEIKSKRLDKKQELLDKFEQMKIDDRYIVRNVAELKRMIDTDCQPTGEIMGNKVFMAKTKVPKKYRLTNTGCC